MARVPVYRFKRWNVAKDAYEVSTRMGTREGIARIKQAVLIEGSAVEIDAALLGREEPGLTDRDFPVGMSDRY